MISKISPVPPTTVHNQDLQPQPRRSSGAQPQDKVYLSPQALAAAKGSDPDHDGDSH